jgi:predicted membrane-bound spermidine synthase
MLGLGLGSLVGGFVSRDPRRPALLLFGLVELSIAIFGVASLPLFHLVGNATLGLSPLATAIVTFLLVLFPTMLMGGTLPLLVADLVRRFRNVGRAVGILYFVNTLGSALASLAAALWLMKHLGQSGTVYVAAAMNAFASLSVVTHHVLTRRAA